MRTCSSSSFFSSLVAASELGAAAIDVRFTRRQVREATGWSNTQLHVHLARLVELEYLLPHRADHGQGFVYELVYDGGGKDGARFVSGLLDVEKLRAEEKLRAAEQGGEAPDHAYEEKHSGVNAPDSGSIRPGFGPDSGPIPDGENADSSSENRARAPFNSENARPRSDENDAAA